MNRENILATIADLKAELANIEATKQQLESSLTGLISLLKSPLISNNKRHISNKATESKTTRMQFPLTPTQGGDGLLLASDRVKTVLINMHGRFRRSELYKGAVNDGNGPIAPGTFANIFSKLIKRNQIKCIEGAPGQRDSIYIKTDEIDTLTESSPEVQTSLIEDEKGDFT